jgi:hypothetical protein
MHKSIFFTQSWCISTSPHYVYIYIQPYFKNIYHIKFQLVFLDNKPLSLFTDQNNALKLVFASLLHR